MHLRKQTVLRYYETTFMIIKENTFTVLEFYNLTNTLYYKKIRLTKFFFGKVKIIESSAGFELMTYSDL